MNEAELDGHVRELCELLDVHRFHCPNSAQSHEGWPDFVLWGPGGVLFRELKSELGRHSLAQRRVLDSLLDAGADASTWRPVDWANGRIERELKAIANGWSI